MEQPQNQSNNKQEAQMPKSNLVRNLLICIGLLLIVMLIFWAFNTASRGTETTYDNMISQIETHNVSELEIGSKYIVAQTNDGKQYWIYNSNNIGELWLDYFADDTNTTFDRSEIKVIVGSSTTFSILNILYPILMIVVLFIVFRMIIKQIGNSNNKTFDFVKNRARITPSNVKFSDVAGADEEKAELEEIIEFLKSPDRFIKMGARIPKGVLLVGPPGTGKTLLAKACAGEANVPFFTISGSDFMELFVGVGASRVRDLFETAKKSKPCIIFIDEIDAVGRQRGAGMGGGNDEREQTLNQLLVQMDGFESNEGIIVIAATNRVDILDPALLRPGRFDRRVFINVPDVKGREEILKIHAKNKPLAEDVNLKQIARITSGFTGADIENMLNEAALLAAKSKSSTITMEDLSNAIAKVTMGPQKRSYVRTEKDIKITAVHESGHAVIAKVVKNGDTVHEVSVVPRGNAGGYTLSRPETDDKYVQKQKLLDMITMLLGGRTAEKLFLDDISTGASNDIERATSLARSMVTEWGMSDAVGLMTLGSENDQVFLGRDYATRANYSEQAAALIDKEVHKIIEGCAKHAEQILSENKKKVNTMVDILLEKETIYQDEIDLIMQGKSKKEILETIKQKTAAEAEAKAQKETLKLVASSASDKENATEKNDNTNGTAAKANTSANNAAPRKTAEKIDIDELIAIAEKRAAEQLPAENSAENSQVSTKTDSDKTITAAAKQENAINQEGAGKDRQTSAAKTNAHAKTATKSAASNTAQTAKKSTAKSATNKTATMGKKSASAKSTNSGAKSAASKTTKKADRVSTKTASKQTNSKNSGTDEDN